MIQSQALSILKTGANVFLTGEPGSGKTHTVNSYVSFLRSHNIEPAITASTGIAATHIGGMTIHSWAGTGIKGDLSKGDLDKIADTKHIVSRIKRTNILIIDEVSMLAPNMLVMIDAVCRKIKQSPAPFGGMQVVLVGDFFQLPPIENRDESGGRRGGLFEPAKARFAYDSPVWKQLNSVVCYLDEQYRQDDSVFLSILSAIRRDEVSEDYFEHIRSRHIKPGNHPENITKLFTHNIDVDRVNDQELDKIKEKSRRFDMLTGGAAPLIAALQRGCLSPEILNLKIGAVVMFTKNSVKDGFANGTLGTVKYFDEYSGYPIVEIRSGKRIEVLPMEWTIEEGGKIKARVSQLPLRLAWAITVHKSQGMSLDEAVMDLSDVFEFGQGYVALSRVRRLSGLHLLGINNQALKVHPEILAKDAIFKEESENTEREFGNVSVDDLEKKTAKFIISCGGILELSDIKKVKNMKNTKKSAGGDTYNETLTLFNNGKNISEAAKERGLTKGTIISHIEKLFADGKIKNDEMLMLFDPILISSLPMIYKAFDELGSEKLTPVFEKLKGQYSYDDIRLARMAKRD